MVRGTVVLPHGLGKTKKVLAIAGGEKQKEAQEAGADIVAGEEIVEKIGRSPDFGTAYVLALMQTSKIDTLLADWKQKLNASSDYDPYDILRMDIR